MTNPSTAPSPLTVNAVRRLAARRGYKLHKLRGKDRYFLVDVQLDQRIYANEDCNVIDDCCFTKYAVVEFLKSEPMVN